MIVTRPPNRMVAEKERQDRLRQEAEQNGGPIPISMVGGGRGGALIAFTEGYGKAR